MLSLMEDAGVSASTRRNTYAALRAALSDAVSDGLLLNNPVEKAKRPKSAKSEAVALTTAEAAEFVRAAASLRYADALTLILYTGLRRGEALGLRWDAVDLDRAEARVSGSLVRLDGALTLSDTKTTNSKRTIALSPSAVALLKAQRAMQTAERLKAGNLWRDNGYIFTTEFGEPADPRNLLRAVKIATQRAGLGRALGAHTLRHTYATVALLKGVPLHVVSRNLGHSSIAITADIYGHLTDAAMQEAAQMVSDAYGF
jgi:integrase